jgi:hypothetical protein
MYIGIAFNLLILKLYKYVLHSLIRKLYACYDVTIEGKNQMFENPDYFPPYPKCDRYCPES